MEGLYAFLCCLGLSLVPVFLLIYNTVVIQRYYFEIEREKFQPPNMVGYKRRFAIVPSVQNDHVVNYEPKYNILAKDIPNSVIETRNVRLVSV